MKIHKMMVEMLIPAIRMLVFFSVLTGFLYPAFILVLAQIFFPFEANGSLITRYGAVTGSQLIGQEFTEPHYFWGRLSATPDYPYNAMRSSASNLGPSDPERTKRMQARLALIRGDLRPSVPVDNARVPIDLVTASGSGLDPDISLEAAQYQITRIAETRQISPKSITELINMKTIGQINHLLEPPRVNVLQLNMALDMLSPTIPAKKPLELGKPNGKTP